MSLKTESFDEASATRIVIERNAGCPDPRLREIMAVLVRHLHEAVRELQLTQQEWRGAIDFLTATGQICSDRRQEFILLSDTLGVSMLVDAINHRKAETATPSTVLGPFHVADAPAMQSGDTISRDGRGSPAGGARGGAGYRRPGRSRERRSTSGRRPRTATTTPRIRPSPT